jgi:hypothetical protein
MSKYYHKIEDTRGHITAVGVYASGKKKEIRN